MHRRRTLQGRCSLTPIGNCQTLRMDERMYERHTLLDCGKRVLAGRRAQESDLLGSPGSS